MSRSRRDTAVSGDIEILDAAAPDPSGAGEPAETADDGGSRWNGLLALGAVALAAAGIASLASGGDEAAAPPTSPPTTQPAPPTTDSALNSSDGDQLTATIGDGPQLDWQRVNLTSDAAEFLWVEDRFISAGGTWDNTITPGSSGASTVIRPPNDSPIRSSSLVTGSGADQNPSSLIFGRPGEQRSIEIEAVLGPFSPLVTPSITVAAELRGDDVIVLQTHVGILDVDAFRARTGIDFNPIFGISVEGSQVTVFGPKEQVTISAAEGGLTAEDVADLAMIGNQTQRLSVGPLGGVAEAVDIDLERIDWIAVVGDEFIAGGTELRRSTNGVDWVATGDDTPRLGGLAAPGPDGVLTGLAFDGDEGLFTTSINAGRSWLNIARPFENTWRAYSSLPIIAMTGWDDGPFVETPLDWRVLTPKVELSISGTNDSFELRDRNGTTLLSGLTNDPASGFRFAPGSPDIWFVDPVTGVEIARIPQTRFGASIAAARTLDGDPQLVAFTDLEQPGNAQEWSVTPVNELFGADALAVAFTPGDGWFLADVTTTTGRELYVAKAPLHVRSRSERHPTHGDILNRAIPDDD